MSKLSFRARALDAGKPMPIYMAEELPDLPDYSAINRAVPQMPSGMQKEEECEHHLQRAIVAGLIIPTPEVTDMPNREFYDKVYPANYKQPRQLIHMQPFTMEQDIPDYDMDSEDERWLQSQAQKLDLSPLKFEEMMDRLEKSSGQTVVTLNEAKALLKEDDDLIIAVFDYWLNKRLKTQHPLILTVKTEHRAGTAPNNPYLAFRRRTEKMQTRKNRKNDEASYEKMLKLRRDLYRAVTLLELVKRREKIKREYVHLTIEVFEKRYQAKDFSGAIMAEASAIKSSRPAFTPIFHNHYPNQSWSNKAILKDEGIPRREKRQYKKRKHKSLGRGIGGVDSLGGGLSSDEETSSAAATATPHLSPDSEEEEGRFAFRRNKSCSYHMPLPHEGNWPWCSREENGTADKRFRFTLTSLSNPRRCIGFSRRRMGRGGRVILDRVSTDYDDFWRTLDFSITEPNCESEVSSLSSGTVRTSVGNGVASETPFVKIAGLEADATQVLEKPPPTEEEKDDMVEFLRSLRRDWLHFRPKTPPANYEPPCDMLLSQDTFFSPTSSGAPFLMEIQPLEGLGGSFLTEPFALDTPITDTRQQSDDYEDPRTIGCSSFYVTDEHRHKAVTCTSTSPKFSDVSVDCGSAKKTGECGGGGGRGGGTVGATLAGTSFYRVKSGQDSSSMSNSANGLLTQFGLDVPANRMRNNKLSYAYSGAVGYPNASPGKLSLHTSAHTLTLNSHSANILDIPITNDPTDADKMGEENSVEGAVSANNKAKTIVRKNNFVMEVT